MGYRIEYTGHGKVQIKRGTKKQIPKWCVFTGFVCFALAALMICWQIEQVRNFLLPGDPEVTANALQELVNDLRGGEGLEDSLTAFCIEVMDHAQILR